MIHSLMTIYVGMLVIKKRGIKRSAYANDLDDPQQAKYNRGI